MADNSFVCSLLSGFWIFTINRSQAVIFPERAMDEAASAELTLYLREKKLLKG